MKSLPTYCLVVTLLWVPAAPVNGASPKPVDIPARRVPTVLTVKRPSGPEWFGLYLIGKKAGWSRMQVTREQHGGVDLLVAREEALVQVIINGHQVERHERVEKTYEARPGGRLLSFDYDHEGDGGNRSFRLNCTPKACRGTFVDDQGTRFRDLLPTAETAEQADAARLAAALQGTITGAQLEPEQLLERKIRNTFESRTTLAGAGVSLAVSVVTEWKDEEQIPSRVSIADDGRIMEIQAGASLVVKAESKEIAQRLDRMELFNRSRIPLQGPLLQSIPATIIFRFKGLPPEFHRNDDRQRFASGLAGETTVTVSVRQPAAANPQQDPHWPVRSTTELEEHLKPSPTIDSDNSDIIKLARQVVGDSQGVYLASTKLVHFVHRRLESVLGQSRDRASEVLRFGKGDCTEHALLFVAMARALGIPARRVHGLVYSQYDDRVPALYWHAWAEVKAGEEWIAVDPTFDQPVADATHVALGDDRRQDSLQLLGSLTVVEAKPLERP